MTSAVHAASQLTGRDPLTWMMPLYLHVNKKSNDDDDTFLSGAGRTQNEYCTSTAISFQFFTLCLKSKTLNLSHVMSMEMCSSQTLL